VRQKTCENSGRGKRRLPSNGRFMACLTRDDFLRVLIPCRPARVGVSDPTTATETRWPDESPVSGCKMDRSDADIFLPLVGVLMFKLRHHLNAALVASNVYYYTSTAKHHFLTWEIDIFADDDPRNLIEQYGS
jgi:hypothetical protein